jgi:site-specific DNA-methyltransferase (adenine-specific)
MGAVIWQKVTTSNTTGGATIMGSFPYPRNGILKLDYEFILIFKKNGGSPKPSKKNKELSRLTKEEWNLYFQGHWNFSGVRQENHLAMFPEELPRRLIKMFSFHGDTVLDPFLGSGTTTLVAKDIHRNSVGYEINSEFMTLIKNKIGATDNLLFNDDAVEFLEQGRLDIEFEDEIKKLPYIFKDTHKLNKKIDPKKMQFGSKIDLNGRQREEYFMVKEIVSPEILQLNNGMTIRLIGVKQDCSQNGKATEYLRNKLKGQKIFLKYDSQKHDEKNNLLCYMYLQNKTFINAHLIKAGLVKVDDSFEYKYKTKFLHF